MIEFLLPNNPINWAATLLRAVASGNVARWAQPDATFTLGS